MRPVTVFKRERIENKWQSVLDTQGTFHSWGVEYEDFETGAGNFTVALVERPDGTMLTATPDLIRFDDR